MAMYPMRMTRITVIGTCGEWPIDPSELSVVSFSCWLTDWYSPDELVRLACRRVPMSDAGCFGLALISGIRDGVPCWQLKIQEKTRCFKPEIHK